VLGWNGWTVSYIVACGLVLAGIWVDRRQMPAVRWWRLGAWLLLATTLAICSWSVLGCAWLQMVERPGPVVSGWHLLTCALGSGYWAGFVAAALLPLYALLVTWYAQRCGGRETTLWTLLGGMLLLSLPGALWIAYAYAFPVHDFARSVQQGASRGGIALASCWLGLALPRVVCPWLGIGALSVAPRRDRAPPHGDVFRDIRPANAMNGQNGLPDRGSRSTRH
jgi:hypothetical protein